MMEYKILGRGLFMQRKNIPAYVLARGVSKKGFERLLADIKNAAVEDGLNKINEYQEMIDTVNAKDKDTDQWVSDFMMQLEESNKVINENVLKIEALFETIFKDWEKYKEENGIVEEEEVPVEEPKEEVVEEKVESKEEIKDDKIDEKTEVKIEEKQEEKEVVENKEESKESKTEDKKEEVKDEKTEEKTEEDRFSGKFG